MDPQKISDIPPGFVHIGKYTMPQGLSLVTIAGRLYQVLYWDTVGDPLTFDIRRLKSVVRVVWGYSKFCPYSCGITEHPHNDVDIILKPEDGKLSVYLKGGHHHECRIEDMGYVVRGTFY